MLVAIREGAHRNDDDRRCESAERRIRDAVMYLEGPISVRLAALTCMLDALCKQFSSVPEGSARLVLVACVRGCRDVAPNVTQLARSGLFRVLRAAVESSSASPRLVTAALKSVVFAYVEHESSDDDARAHMIAECDKFLRHSCSLITDGGVHDTLKLLVSGGHREAIQDLRPPTMQSISRISPPSEPVKAIALDPKQRRLQDIERARARRLKADDEAEEHRKKLNDEAERREKAFKRRAHAARFAYLNKSVPVTPI